MSESAPGDNGSSPDEVRPRIPTWVRAGAVLVVLIGAVAFLVMGSEASNAFVYSKLVHEVVSNPAAFADRELRVEGDLKQGSIRFRESPCEWRFSLAKNGREMPVEFSQCVVPDTFRDNMGISVTVQGRIRQDGVFVANQVVPRCPSKYEMKQRMQKGEVIPHAMPNPS